MKTKIENWENGTFEIKLNNDEFEKVEGKIYKIFGVKTFQYKHRELYHIPTKSILGRYEITLYELKIIVDKLLEIDIYWTSSDNEYYEELNEVIKDKIQQILRN